MTKKKQYEKPTLISFNKKQKGNGNCNSNGSGDEDDCLSNGVSAGIGCGEGSSAIDCSMVGSDPI